MSDLEEVLAAEEGDDSAMYRSQQKACERYEDLVRLGLYE